MNKPLTPAMQQYYDIKKEHPDTIVFFRMGDFYEMFGEDAYIAHRVLGINVTSRNKNAKDPLPMAGIPYHAKDKYLPGLVQAGYKVAIVEQVSDPKAKGIVQRKVVRVVTPATLHLEGESYDIDDSSTLIALSFSLGVYGFSLLDLATGVWKTRDYRDIETLKQDLYFIAPKEVILQKNLYQNTILQEIFSKKHTHNVYYFDGTLDAQKLLCQHFGVKNLDGFGIGQYKNGIVASGLLLEYLQTNQKTTLSLLKGIGVYDKGEFVHLDSATIANLDLVYNFAIASQKSGTLYSILNATQTPMGNRVLKDHILQPLKNKDAINQRLNFVEILKKDTILLNKIRTELKYIGDMDAILNRVSLERNSPQDLIRLKDSLKAIVRISEILQSSKNPQLKEFFS